MTLVRFFAGATPSLSADNMPSIQKKMTRSTIGVLPSRLVSFSDHEDASTGYSSAKYLPVLFWRRQSNTSNAKYMTASFMRSVCCSAIILSKLKFCIIENTVNGGLKHNKFGMVSSIGLSDVSVARAELKSQGCPYSSTADRSNKQLRRHANLLGNLGHSRRGIDLSDNDVILSFCFNGTFSCLLD